MSFCLFVFLPPFLLLAGPQVKLRFNKPIVADIVGEAAKTLLRAMETAITNATAITTAAGAGGVAAPLELPPSCVLVSENFQSKVVLAADLATHTSCRLGNITQRLFVPVPVEGSYVRTYTRGFIVVFIYLFIFIFIFIICVFTFLFFKIYFEVFIYLFIYCCLLDKYVGSTYMICGVLYLVACLIALLPFFLILLICSSPTSNFFHFLPQWPIYSNYSHPPSRTLRAPLPALCWRCFSPRWGKYSTRW